MTNMAEVPTTIADDFAGQARPEHVGARTILQRACSRRVNGFRLTDSVLQIDDGAIELADLNNLQCTLSRPDRRNINLLALHEF